MDFKPSDAFRSDFIIGQFVLSPTGLVTKVLDVDSDGRVTVEHWDGKVMVRPFDDYIPVQRLTREQWDVLEGHTRGFSRSWTRRGMVMRGRRCKCHGLFYLGKKVEHPPAYPDRFRQTGELYALFNLSGVQNILYLLEGRRADDHEAD